MIEHALHERLDRGTRLDAQILRDLTLLGVGTASER